MDEPNVSGPDSPSQRQPPPEAPRETYSGQVLPPSSPPGSPPPGSPPPSYQEYRRPRVGGIVAGVVVIVIGVFFLGDNLGWWSSTLHNWWALFILIPAVGSLTDAWRHYVAHGRQLNGQVARSLVIGLLLVLVTLIFLLDLQWSYVWPVVIILIGVGLLLGRWRREG